MNARDLGYQQQIYSGQQSQYFYPFQNSRIISSRPQIQTLTKSQLSQLKFAPLQEHNIHYHTDKLYDPLRNTLMHPETIRSHEKQISRSVHHSYLTNHYKILTPQQAENIKSNIWIPQDVDLAQTDHFYKVKDKQFVAVNTQTKVIGKPISPRELERIKQEGLKRSMVVYDLKQRVEEVDPITTYQPSAIQSYGKKQYQYNLYSIIDEPMNWVREFGCKGANWCVPNEFIASKNQPQSLRWIN